MKKGESLGKVGVQESGKETDLSPLIREVATALSLWEDSADLYQEFAERLVRLIVEHRITAEYFSKRPHKDG